MGIDDFAQVQEALWKARSKWENIGTRLKLDVHELENIDAEGGMSVDKKFNLMIKARLKKLEPCTWRDLYDALNHPTVDMPDVASKLPPGRLTFTGPQSCLCKQFIQLPHTLLMAYFPNGTYTANLSWGKV